MRALFSVDLPNLTEFTAEKNNFLSVSIAVING